MDGWQRDIPIEKLRAFAAPFKARHKSLVFGAFGLIKERDLADYMARNRAIWTGNPPEAVALFTITKVASEQQDFAQRAFRVQPGSVSIKAFAAMNAAAGAKVISALRERSGGAPLWIEIFEEDEIARAAIAAAGGFNYVTSKVSAGSEIKGLYFTGAPPLPQLDPADEATLLVVDRDFLTPAEHAAIKSEVAQFSNLWAQHYSNYNKRKSWEAFALRGYDDEPGFIIKPAEMSKSWKEENAARLTDRPRPTKAAQHFPATLEFCTRLVPLEQADRIRFMRLRSKGGELSRHADITDREAGTADGAIARMHIPIVTSAAVRFRGWTARGQRLETAFPERALCYLDQRKPHAVTNSDPTLDRVHLVVDCIASAALRRQLEAAQQRFAVAA